MHDYTLTVRPGSIPGRDRVRAVCCVGEARMAASRHHTESGNKRASERHSAPRLAPGCTGPVPRAWRGARVAKAPQTRHLSHSRACPSIDEPKGSGYGSASAPGDSERGARDLPGDVRTFPRRALHPETRRARISDYSALSRAKARSESQRDNGNVTRKVILESRLCRGGGKVWCRETP